MAVVTPIIEREGVGFVLEHKVREKVSVVIDDKEFIEGQDIAITMRIYKYIANIYRIIKSNGEFSDALILSNIEIYEGSARVPKSGSPKFMYVEIPDIIKVSYVSVD